MNKIDNCPEGGEGIIIKPLLSRCNNNGCEIKFTCFRFALHIADLINDENNDTNTFNSKLNPNCTAWKKISGV